jgi:hypothetical protein
LLQKVKVYCFGMKLQNMKEEYEKSVKSGRVSVKSGKSFVFCFCFVLCMWRLMVFFLCLSWDV